MHNKTRHLGPGLVKLICAALLVCISCFYAGEKATSQQTQPASAKGEGFELAIATTKKQFNPFEPIVVQVILSNVTNETLSLQGFGVQNDYDVHVAYNSGIETPYTQYGKGSRIKRLGGGNRRTLTLLPGQSLPSYITVNQIFDMSLAGTYKIVVERWGIKKQPGEGQFTLASTPIEVEVTGVSAFKDAPSP